MRTVKNDTVSLWLLGLISLLLGLIMLGGATRLTHSGLSIVEWKPLTGIIPPLTQLAWEKAFEAYQQFPEFKLVNAQITLSEFKFIYLMEFAHRLLARFVGFCFMIPLLFLWKRFSAKEKRLLVIAFITGIGQGLMGWYMVKSGLVKDPAVSHIRLALHLMLALVLLGIFFWMLLNRLFPVEQNVKVPFGVAGGIFLQLLTICYGAFVAGLKAGHIYNTFPLMEGQWFPVEGFFYTPLWINFIENHALVQWCHRVLALSSLVWVSILFHMYGKIMHSWFLLTLVQIALGIATLLFNVPIFLGVAHQGGAMLVFLAALWSAYRVSIIAFTSDFSRTRCSYQ